jgi:WD40 repeat protein
VTTSNDNTARVGRDLSSQHPVSAVLEGHTGPVRSASFGPDGKMLLTISDDGIARLWPLQPSVPDFIRKVESELGRCLTLTQREVFGLPTENISLDRNHVAAPDKDGHCPR